MAANPADEVIFIGGIVGARRMKDSPAHGALDDLFSIVTFIAVPIVAIFHHFIFANHALFDIIDFDTDPAVFVGNALSPAKVVSVTVVDAAAKAARVIVPDYQLSLAIGKEGQNARLAAKLTGAKIDIQPDSILEDA